MAYIYNKRNDTLIETSDENMISLAEMDPQIFIITDDKPIIKREKKPKRTTKDINDLSIQELRKIAESKDCDVSAMTIKELRAIAKLK